MAGVAWEAQSAGQPPSAQVLASGSWLGFRIGLAAQLIASSSLCPSPCCALSPCLDKQMDKILERREECP